MSLVSTEYTFCIATIQAKEALRPSSRGGRACSPIDAVEFLLSSLYLKINAVTMGKDDPKTDVGKT